MPMCALGGYHSYLLLRLGNGVYSDHVQLNALR
jgi:hypothetical protein